jgi:hypothetical protein
MKSAFPHEMREAGGSLQMGLLYADSSAIERIVELNVGDDPIRAGRFLCH